MFAILRIVEILLNIVWWVIVIQAILSWLIAFNATREAGMESFEHCLPADTSAADLLALVARLNADPAVDGILVQLPLPPHIDERRVIEANFAKPKSCST